MHKRILAVATALVMIPLIVSSPGWAAPRPQARSVVTYPTNGTTISGAVQITGIATHPNMLWYQVDYAPGPEPTGGSQWTTVAHVENVQVENGVLAVWDTTGLPDGLYCLALTVSGQNDSLYYQQFVTYLTISNAQAATPTPQPPTPEPLPTAVIGPTPTPASVEQPATPTPRPSPTPQGGAVEEAATPSAGRQAGLSIPLQATELRSAFCTGGLITVMLFLLGGCYLLAKAVVRWFMRDQHLHRPPE